MRSWVREAAAAVGGAGGSGDAPGAGDGGGQGLRRRGPDVRVSSSEEGELHALLEQAANAEEEAALCVRSC